MIRNSQITDPTLGEIAVRRDSRAKHLILRCNGETVAVTAPPGTPDSIIRDFIGKHRNRLEELVGQRRPKALRTAKQTFQKTGQTPRESPGKTPPAL